MHDRLAIEFISVLGMPPADFAHLAADLGVARIGLAPEPITANPHRYPAWSLRDPEVLRATRRALRETGVRVSLGEGFLLRPDGEAGRFAADLDLMAELGAACVNLVLLEPDRARAVDQLARFADLAGARGIEATIEFMPGVPAGDLAAALELREAVGRANFKVLVDCMHLARSGGTPAELAAAARSVGYLQLCDVPAAGGELSYGEEAKHHRLPPGEGELPLAAILAAAPADVPVGLEIPQVSLAEQGVGPRQRLAPAIAAACRLLVPTEEPA